MRTFVEYLKEVPTLELVMLQHEARKVDDAVTLHLVLEELGKRSITEPIPARDQNEQTTIP